MFCWQSRGFRILLLLLLMLTVAGQQASVSNVSAATDGKSKDTLRQEPLTPPGKTSKPLQPPPANLPSQNKMAAQAAGNALAATKAVNTTMDLKVLVVAADGNEADLPAIKQILDYLGTPYDVYVAAKSPGGLTNSKLIDAANSAHIYYQGVILTNSYLGYAPAGGGWQSALSAAEWSTLWNFETIYSVRQVNWYTYPTPDDGFNFTSTPSGVNTDTTPISVPFTAAGRSIFGIYANVNTPISIQYAYTYLATPLDSNTQPLLADSAGNALAAVRTFKDTNGDFLRESLSMTFDSNPYLLHNLTLAYGLVNWVTNGIFLGQRQTSILAQPDDIFNDDFMWTPNLVCGSSTDNTGTTYRLTGDDWQKLINWQTAKQGQSTTAGFKLEMPFNAVGTTATWLNEEGTTAGQYKPDTLTPLAKTAQGQFNWISHTYDHENLDAISAADATTELTKNNQIANQLGLQYYSKKTLVTPDVSGLDNPNFLQSAYTFGVRYVVSDTSITTATDPLTGKPRHIGVNPSPNAGRYNAIQPGILEIPRHPVNLYFNVSTPEQWLAEDKCLYPVGAYGHIETYAQLLDRVSNQLLIYLLQSDIDPWMFHQPNLRAYDGTHSVLGDLLDATIAKYNQISILPIQSPTQEQVGLQMAARMAYNASGVKAQLVGNNKINLTAQKDATIPITGIVSTCGNCTAAPYGKQNVTMVKIKAGQTINLTLEGVAPLPTGRLSVTAITPKTGPIAGGTTVTLTGKNFTADATVAFDGAPATSTTFVNATSITAVAPAHAAGAVTVTVTIDGQQATLPNGYTYTGSTTSTTGTAGTTTTASPTSGPAPIPQPRGGPVAPSASSAGGTPQPAPAPVPGGR
jgi:hypothetical protein